MCADVAGTKENSAARNIIIQTLETCGLDVGLETQPTVSGYINSAWVLMDLAKPVYASGFVSVKFGNCCT